MKIGVIGSGVVGQTLGAGFLKHGHEVMLGARDPAKLFDWGARPFLGKDRHVRRRSAIWRDRRARGRRRGRAGGAEARRRRGARRQGGDRRLQPDRRRPAGQRRAVTLHDDDGFADGAAAGRVSRAPVSSRRSTASARRRWSIRVFAGGRPTMFVCGGDGEAKKTVAALLDQFGWDTEDMGAVEAARAIEPLCMLWCIPGVGRGDWSPHAFKLLR